MTCSNSSFSLTMVTPTSYFFAFHWWRCLLLIGYLPRPGSVGVRICHYHRIQLRPPFRWFSDIFDQMHLFLTSTVFTATVGMVTFQQSPCWYYPWADVAMSTSSDTQHLWTWWHFGDHTGCYILIYIFIQHYNDTLIKTHEGRKTQEELRCRKEDTRRLL